MAEQIELKDTQEALVEAYCWMQDFYDLFRQQTGLSIEAMSSMFRLKDSLALPDMLDVETSQGIGLYHIIDLEPSIQLRFGAPVACLRIVQLYPGSAPAGAPEGMMVATSADDYSQASYMSMAWRYGESDVLYMGMCSLEGKVVSISQVTAPEVLLAPLVTRTKTRNNAQQFETEFLYNDGKLTSWTVEMQTPERALPQEADVLVRISSVGERVVVGPLRHQYLLPETIFMAEAIRNIISQKPALIPITP